MHLNSFPGLTLYTLKLINILKMLGFRRFKEISKQTNETGLNCGIDFLLKIKITLN